jgi:hypothetical protein
MTVEEMEGGDSTIRRGLSSSVYAECSTRDAIPRGEVAPASEEVERTLRLVVVVRFLCLFFEIVFMCKVEVFMNLWRRDELRCARLEREGGRCCNQGGLCAGGSTTRITNAVGKIN